MKINSLALALILGLGWPRTCLARSGGGDPFSFLFLDGGARPAAMGGAYTALATDSNALLYNPAGLGQIALHEVTFMHNQYFQGITQEYLGFASKQGWGADLNYLSFGDVPTTTIANPAGIGLGNSTLRDLAAAAGYGRTVTDSLALGASLKFVRESLSGASAQGVGIDLGVLYAVPVIERLTLGAAVQNIGPPVKFTSAREQMPLNVRFGAAYDFEGWGRQTTIAADISKERSQQAFIGLGAEVFVVKSLPLRLGFNTRTDAGMGITAGVGWRHRDLDLDYAVVHFGDLGLIQRLSVTFRWGRKPKAAETPTAYFLP